MVHTRRSGDLDWIEYRPNAKSLLTDPFEVSGPIALVTHVGWQSVIAYDGQTKIMPKWLKILVNV
jgi:hypothetical protein